MDSSDLRGVFPPIPTPFDAEGDIDRDALKRNLTWWNDQAFSGYVVLGSNGEAAHLVESEKLALIAAVRAAASEDRIVIAGTGLLFTAATIWLTQQAAAAGADVALVLPPFFYRGLMTSAVLTEHFERVADASPIPILLYNMPANTGIDLPASIIIDLSRHENVAGVKDSSGNVAKLSEIRHAVDPGFAILAGSAGFLLPALSVGADGGVLALANIAPAACLEIFDLATAGEWEKARAIQNRLVRANATITRRWGVPALKAAMDELGLYGGPPRRPLLPLADELRAELREILREACILEL